MSFKLPSLVALRAFEAVARCGSVRSAAEDLNVVHGAVSQQIRSLEEQLGVSLFERRGRRLLLTSNGKRFSDAIQDAFGAIERAAAEITPTAHKRPFRLGIMRTFGAYWLVPRLHDLVHQKPGFELELVTTPVLKNLEDTNLDAVVVGGDYVPRPEIDGTRFMDDIVGPVMSPEVAARLEITNGPHAMSRSSALVTSSQLHLWDEWFAATNTPSVRFSRRHVFDSLTLTIEAARSDLGIAIVPRAYIEGYLIAGTLIAPFGFFRRSGGYYFLCRTRDAQLPDFRNLRSFLLKQGLPPEMDS
ncbi:LysR family transcriptional regulator [Agrobacterium tumefaciens]|uniref:LysR substrate-binding domain-containing protein n=1 Tax=Agrobacterium tumefaciens TaxID=358 RepID=UPI0012B99A09|nr:LysR substrate-binding domain-containing protein [Agrobacterium tumefaciens]MQB04457.1 LysR family transcriptional regulator [Agrobacterium tumefaciens]